VSPAILLWYLIALAIDQEGEACKSPLWVDLSFLGLNGYNFLRSILSREPVALRLVAWAPLAECIVLGYVLYGRDVVCTGGMQTWGGFTFCTVIGISLSLLVSFVPSGQKTVCCAIVASIVTVIVTGITGLMNSISAIWGIIALFVYEESEACRALYLFDVGFIGLFAISMLKWVDDRKAISRGEQLPVEELP